MHPQGLAQRCFSPFGYSLSVHLQLPAINSPLSNLNFIKAVIPVLKLGVEPVALCGILVSTSASKCSVTHQQNDGQFSVFMCDFPLK